MVGHGPSEQLDLVKVEKLCGQNREYNLKVEILSVEGPRCMRVYLQELPYPGQPPKDDRYRVYRAYGTCTHNEVVQMISLGGVA